jgi:hypothetical protein
MFGDYARANLAVYDTSYLWFAKRIANLQILRTNDIITKGTLANVDQFRSEIATKNLEKILVFQQSYSRTRTSNQCFQRLLFDTVDKSYRNATLPSKFDEEMINNLSTADIFLTTLMANTQQLNNLTTITKNIASLTPLIAAINDQNKFQTNSLIEFDEIDDGDFTADLNDVMLRLELLSTTTSFFKKN